MRKKPITITAQPAASHALFLKKLPDITPPKMLIMV
jgi:hypothetical protein